LKTLKTQRNLPLFSYPETMQKKKEQNNLFRWLVQEAKNRKIG